MATKRLYKGYMSNKFDLVKTFKSYDIELVKADLLNHIFTRRGERVMMPRFGTEIPELVFEPLTEDLVDLIKDEVRTVIEYDPRVSLINLQANADFDRQTVNVAANVLYVELNVTDNLEFNIEFEA